MTQSTTDNNENSQNSLLPEHFTASSTNNVRPTVWIEMKDDAPIPLKILVPVEEEGVK